MLPKYEGGTGYVRELDDHVIGGAEAVKFAMDRFGDEFKVWFNDTFLPSLKATTLSNSGADNIGTTPILPNADTVQKTLAALLAQIQSSALGQIPDGTVTDAKLSNAAGQTKAKITTLENNVSTLGGEVLEKMPIEGGAFTGEVKAQNNTNYTTAQIRNIILSDTDAVLASMANGDLWVKYE